MEQAVPCGQLKLVSGRGTRQIQGSARRGACVLVAGCGAAASVQGRERRACYASACSMAATGFTLITLQIVLLLAFQAIYGYVYYQLAILIGVCMAGLAMGSWLSMRRTLVSDRSPCRSMASTQILLALSAPVLMVVISLLARLSGAAATWLADLVFPALAALSGIRGELNSQSQARYTFPAAAARPGEARFMPSICWADAWARSC